MPVIRMCVLGQASKCLRAYSRVHINACARSVGKCSQERERQCARQEISGLYLATANLEHGSGCEDARQRVRDGHDGILSLSPQPLPPLNRSTVSLATDAERCLVLLENQNGRPVYVCSENKSRNDHVCVADPRVHRGVHRVAGLDEQVECHGDEQRREKRQLFVPGKVEKQMGGWVSAMYGE